MSKLSEIIDELAAIGSTIAKTKILTDNKDNDDLKTLFWATLSPRINYYLKIDKMEALSMDAGTDRISFGLIYSIVCHLNRRIVTGHAARNYVASQMAGLVKEDQILLARMINGDLECKVAAGLVNKVWKDLIEEYPVMLACKLDKKRLKKLQEENHKEFLIQLKADGGRCNARIEEDSSVTYFSRNGNQMTLHGALDEDLKGFAGFVVDGELLVESSSGVEDRKTGNGFFTKAVRGTITPAEAARFTFLVWDIIPIEQFDKGYDSTPYTERLSRLETFVSESNSKKIKVILSKTVSNLDEAQEFYSEMLADGQEGAILKIPNMPWEARRSANMIKMKEEREGDFLVVGFEPHSKKPEWIGALLVQTSCGKLKARVGSGFNDKDREQPPEHYLEKIVKLKFNEIIMAKGRDTASLFLPIYAEVRVDKEIANSLEELEK